MNSPVVAAGPAGDAPAGAGAASLWALAALRAARTPEALAAVDRHGDEVTFEGLVARAERTAAGLAALGVRPGDVVSWQLPNRVTTIVLTLALSRLGAVQNPLVMMLRAPELAFICRQAGTRLLVAPRVFRGADHAEIARRTAAEVPGLAVLDAEDGLPAADPGGLPPASQTQPGPGDQRWIFYTSGTTSAPKGARHTDAGLLAASATVRRALRVDPTDRVAVLAPLAHIGGIAHVATALAAGSAVITSDVFDPATTPGLLAAHGVTLVGSGVPFIRAYLDRQAADPARPLFPAARAFLCGGSPRPAGLDETVKAAFGGVGTVSGYGMTECPNLCWGLLDDVDSARATTEGPPGPGGEVLITGADGHPAPAGETGEILVRGPQLMLGYVDAALDADAFSEKGFFRTGDLGFLDGDGRLTITGRAKDVIIRNMENISAREVEEPLAEHPAVADAAVVGVPDERTGERVCAVVVPVDADRPPSLADLCDHLLTRGLNRRKLPERLVLVGELPRNAMGKVVKPRLRELAAGAGLAPGGEAR